MMTKTKGVRKFAGVTSADLQVFAQHFCNGLLLESPPEIIQLFSGVLVILLSSFKLRSATEAGRLCVDQEIQSRTLAP
jgi:hypothetical protein